MITIQNLKNKGTVNFYEADKEVQKIEQTPKQILQIIGCLCSLWIYIDASGHKIGRTPQGGFLNMGAGWWGVLSFLIWIIIFPLYLIKREKLIALSKNSESPVKPTVKLLPKTTDSSLNGYFINSSSLQPLIK